MPNLGSSSIEENVMKEMSEAKEAVETKLAVFEDATSGLVEMERRNLREGGHTEELIPDETAALLIGELGEFVDIAKSDLRDYELANLYSVLAMATAVAHPKACTAIYEDAGNPESDYYDISVLRSAYNSFPSINLPVPMLRESFLELLHSRLEENKDKIDVTLRGDHNRNFSQEVNGEELNGKSYIAMGKFLENVDLDPLLPLVLSDENVIKNIKDLAVKCKEAYKDETGEKARRLFQDRFEGETDEGVYVDDNEDLTE